MIEWLLSQLQQPLLGYGQFSSVLGYPTQAPILGIRSAGGELPLRGKGPVMDLPATPQNLGGSLNGPPVSPPVGGIGPIIPTTPMPGPMPMPMIGGGAGTGGPMPGIGGGAGGNTAPTEPAGYGEGIAPATSQPTGYGSGGLVGGIASPENVQPRGGFRGGKGPVARLEDLAGRPPRGNWLVR